MLFCCQYITYILLPAYSLLISRVPRADFLTWHRNKLCVIGWMAKICYTVPVISTMRRKNYSVNSAHEQPVGPVIEQISDIDKNGREVIIFTP